MSGKHAVILAALFLAILLPLHFNEVVDRYWGIISLVFLILFLAEFVFLFDDRIVGSKDVALIAILGSISAASRIPFAGVPSVQPSTFIIIVAGYTLGAYAGFMVGMETALLSNFFLGQGPWTPWQMLAWGLIGIMGASVRFTRGGKHEMHVLILIGIISGYLFGVITNLWYWLAFIYPHTLASFLMVESLSLYFDTLHSIGNVIFITIFGEKFVKILSRYGEKINTSGNVCGSETAVKSFQLQ